jgi:hypothetical protein
MKSKFVELNEEYLFSLVMSCCIVLEEEFGEDRMKEALEHAQQMVANEVELKEATAKAECERLYPGLQKLMKLFIPQGGTNEQGSSKE